MIIADLNYLETITDESNVQGAGGCYSYDKKDYSYDKKDYKKYDCYDGKKDYDKKDYCKKDYYKKDYCYDYKKDYSYGYKCS